ncbi:MAG: murein hydrolase activator EnvC family protein [Candidatus Omnitrophota bacterium]
MKNIFLLFVFFLLPALSGCAVNMGIPGRVENFPTTDSEGIIHRVRKGQTLWRIARAYGVDLEALVKVNKIADKAKIKIGQKLLIPGAKQKNSLLVFNDENDSFIWPVDGDVVGYFKQNRQHSIGKGIDIGASDGADIFSSRAGVVSFCAKDLKGYGGTIIIDHRDGFFTVYAYNSKNLVRLDQYLKKGAIIAKVGHRPGDDKPIVHFQIRKKYRPVNPLYYLAPPERSGNQYH